MSDPKECSKFALKVLLYRNTYNNQLSVDFLYEAYKSFIDLQLIIIDGVKSVPKNLSYFATHGNDPNLQTLKLLRKSRNEKLSEEILLVFLGETSETFQHYLIQMVITHNDGVTMLYGSRGPPAPAGLTGPPRNLFDIYGNEITDTYVAPATDNLMNFAAKQRCYPTNVDPALKEILDYFHRM